MGFPNKKWVLCLGITLGLAGGSLLGLWPEVPLHAVATDRIESFAMATGPVDSGVEAVYFLDFLTGDLNAMVIGRARTPTGYAPTSHYAANVMTDLGLDAGKNPKFLMATGMVADLMRGGGGGAIRPGHAVLYVAEVTTGQAAVYAIRWNANKHVQGAFDQSPLLLIAKFPIRQAAVGGAKNKDKE